MKITRFLSTNFLRLSTPVLLILLACSLTAATMPLELEKEPPEPGFTFTAMTQCIERNGEMICLPAYRVNTRSAVPDIKLFSEAAETSTPDISAPLNGSQPPGAISGYVRNAANTDPLPNALVWAYGERGYGYAFTGSNGIYEISNLAPGAYTVTVQLDGYAVEYFDNHPVYAEADLVTVNSEKTSMGINFNLDFGGTISGQVTDIFGSSLSDVFVYFVELDMGTCTDLTGNYSFESIPFETSVTVMTDGNCRSISNYVSEYWQETPYASQATPLTVTAGSPEISGIDFTLAMGGSLSGRVTDAVTGFPIESTFVYAYSADGGGGGYTWTDKKGNYTIYGLPAGDVKVDVSFEDGYAFEYYNDKRSWDTANRVSIQANQNTSGINFELDAGGIVGGTVMKTNLFLLSDIRVDFEFPGETWSTCTNAFGEYTYSRVPHDVPFTVRAGGSCGNLENFAYQYWEETFNENEAVILTTTSLEPMISSINFFLSPGGSVYGRVTDTMDSPLKNIQVTFIFDQTILSTCTGFDGYYSFDNIPYYTPFKVMAGEDCGNPDNPVSYQNEYWQETELIENAAQLSLSNGTPLITGIDFTLEPETNTENGIEVTIGNTLMETIPVEPNQYHLAQYPVEGGPVVISSNDGQNLVASLFQLRRPTSTGGWTGIAHLMGIPQENLSDTYVFPYFDATTSDMYNVFTIGNVDTISTTVSVTIGGVFYDDYDLAPSDALVVRPPLKGGPIVIQSDNGARIISQLYELKRDATSGPYNGQSQMTGLPAENLSDTYIIPWYNNILTDLSGTIIFANVDSFSTDVTVAINGVPYGTYPMLPNTVELVQYAAEGGPVVISSSNGANIVASLFQLRRPASTGGWTGIAHLMGIPQEQLSDTYVFPYFDATTSNMYNVFTIGNVDTVSTTVSVTIGGVFYDDYDLAPSDALVVRPPLKGGPIVIQSDNGAKIIAQLYELKRDATSGPYNGQSQMTGMQYEKLSDTYIIPWYNNILTDLSGTIIFSVP